LSKTEKPETIKAMEPIWLPTEEEINTAYQEGQEAVLKLFQATLLCWSTGSKNWKTNWRITAAIVENRPPVTASRNLRRAVYANAVASTLEGNPATRAANSRGSSVKNVQNRCRGAGVL
jgi:hypothetical protein